MKSDDITPEALAEGIWDEEADRLQETHDVQWWKDAEPHDVKERVHEAKRILARLELPSPALKVGDWVVWKMRGRTRCGRIEGFTKKRVRISWMFDFARFQNVLVDPNRLEKR